MVESGGETKRLDPARFDLGSMTIREILLARLEEIDRRPSWATRVGSSEAVIYRFLAGDAETNSENVAALLQRCGLVIRPAPGFRPVK